MQRTIIGFHQDEVQDWVADFACGHQQHVRHTLPWLNRPLQCPRCQSRDVDPWGTYHYRPGCKRYWCNGCKVSSQ